MKKNKFKEFAAMITKSSWQVKLSAVLMGSGQILYGRIGKGMMFLAIQIAFIMYVIKRGITDFIGFFTLGTEKANTWSKVAGDNSVVMLLMGILAWIVLILFAIVHNINLKDAYQTQLDVENGKKKLSLVQEFKKLCDRKFYIASLTFPVIGVCVFSILPIVFMILIAFTNYGGDIVPPELVDWVGFDNFKKLISLKQFSSTFGHILLWNLVWAVVATFLNYFAGLGLALLINHDNVKCKAVWRFFPILAVAIPGFISLLAYKFLFSYSGPINQIIASMGYKEIGFFSVDAKWTARLIGLFVNCWTGTPMIMMLATGMLSNRDKNIYEAANLDGATKWKQFTKLTLPFMIFSTTPVLISQFIANFNNFGVFYFLRDGIYQDGYFLANNTDLLINWLFNMSISNNYYSTGAAISIIIFVITSVISLTVYVKSPAFREDDLYR